MRIGIDLGGTKIEAILLAADGREVARERIGTPRGGAAGIVTALAGLTQALEQRAGEPCTTGIATPGSLSPLTGALRNSNTVELNGFPLQQALESALARPVRLANDADCFTLSEATDGAAAKAAIAFGVIVGTGTGGGIVVNGSLLAGANGIAGEWGHNPLPWPAAGEGRDDGPLCWCGKRACIETFLSGPGLSADFARHDARMFTAAEIVAAAASGDIAALAALERYYDRFARALATAINLLDPDVIVLGGGMSNLAALYEELPRRVGAYIFSDVLRTRIVPAHRGDSSGVRGAAWLWKAGESDRRDLR